MTEKYLPIHKEENRISYTLHGDVYLPDLKLSDDNRPIGRYGRLYLNYLKEQIRLGILPFSCQTASLPVWQTSTRTLTIFFTLSSGKWLKPKALLKV